MSLPVVLPGSCCPLPGTSPLPEPPHRTRARGFSASPRSSSGVSRLLLPGRPLLSLGLLQLLLGGSMVALSFGALSLSSSTTIRTSCPFWAGSSVILSGIIGLITWKKPLLVLVNVFVLLSVVCVLLNLAGFILCCQGAQLVSSMTNCQLSESGDVCYCCSLSPAFKCSEDERLQLHPSHSCSTMRILLKKVLFALCALNALTTAVCLMAAALRYLQIFTDRAPCVEESRASAENREEPSVIPDPDDFVAPDPPPSYFSTFYSYTPRLSFRSRGNNVIPLPHIYGARIKGVEVFCPLDPPPPYEAVAGGHTEQSVSTLNAASTPPRSSAEDTETQTVSTSEAPPLPPPPPPQSEQLQNPSSSSSSSSGIKPKIRRSKSDPVLMDLPTKVKNITSPPQTADSSTQTSQPTLAPQAPPTLASQAQVTLRWSRNRSRTPRRPRPTSMVDYQSYQHTQHLVRKILEQPATRGLAPEVQELVDSIRTVLQSDQEHMEEAVRCASYIEQAFTDSALGSRPPKPPQLSHTFPLRPHRTAGLLHLSSCGDLSSYTCPVSSRKPGPRGAPGTASRSGSRSGSRVEHPERAHSLVGVSRETEL